MAVYVFALKQLSSDAALTAQYWTGSGAVCEPFVTAFSQLHQTPSGPTAHRKSAMVAAAALLAPVPESPPIPAKKTKGGLAGEGAPITRTSSSGNEASELEQGGDSAGSGVGIPSMANLQAADGSTGSRGGGQAKRPVAIVAPKPVIVGYEVAPDGGMEDGGTVRGFPQRPGKPLCEFYSRTGHCKVSGALYLHKCHLRNL